MTTSTGPGRSLPAAAALQGLLALILSGCGGGIWFGVGDGDDPPTVALAVNVTAARPGEAVQLVAAAGDDFAIDHVAFYVLDPATGGATLLARDSEAPYRVDVAMPAALTDVRFFARAVDDVGQATDSAVVSVAVLP